MKVLYYSFINWRWIKQRPHYISIYLKRKGLDLDFAYPYVFAKSLISRNYFVKNDGCTEINKIKIKQIPKENSLKFVKRINDLYRIAQLKNLLRKRHYQAIIITHPSLYNKIIANSSCPIVYEMMDNYLEFKNLNSEIEYMKNEESLCNDAQAIIVSSDSLKQLLINRYPECEKKIRVINNAFDIEVLMKMDTTKQITSGNGRNLVYIGTISNWIDHESLIAYAENHKDDRIKLIGPIENFNYHIEKKIRDQQNIEMIGPIEHGSINLHINSGDVMLIPFIVNSLIEYVDPIKVYEYICFHKPIVCTMWREMEKFKEFVDFYNPVDTMSFEHAVKRAIERSVDEELYQSFISNNTWEVRVGEYYKIIESIETKKY